MNRRGFLGSMIAAAAAPAIVRASSLMRVTAPVRDVATIGAWFSEDGLTWRGEIPRSCAWNTITWTGAVFAVIQQPIAIVSEVRENGIAWEPRFLAYADNGALKS